jgi:hypothetical protein
LWLAFTVYWHRRTTFNGSSKAHPDSESPAEPA